MLMEVRDSFLLDDYIDESTYNAQAVPEFGDSSWYDGNWKLHKDIVRERITGTVTLCFKTFSWYQAYVSILSSPDYDDGTFDVRLYVNNKGAMRNIRAYLTFTTRVVFASKAFDQTPAFWALDLVIEEK